MKKILLLIALFTLVFVGCKDDGTDGPGTGKDDGVTFLASKDLANRNAVLEDFTGVRCTYCPDGHRIAKELIDDSPEGRVVVIGVNSGLYAWARSGWANFTTPFGEAFISQSGVSGFPAGTMNRHLFVGKGQKNGLAMGRNHWKTTANMIMALESSVNIGAKATFDAATRELKINVDLYYTSADTVENNINIGLLQDGLVAKQVGGGNTYVHPHILRDLITGQWGDAVPADKTAKDSKYSKTYTYTVPTDFNGEVIPPGGGAVDIANCEIVIFVAQGRTEIITGITVAIEVK